MNTRALVLLLFLLPAVDLAAGPSSRPSPHQVEWQPPVDPPLSGNYIGEPGIPADLMTEGFLSAHPDLRWRREGLHSYANARYDEAMQHFLRAARYADKPAQAMISEMYWKGIGVPKDRAIGYAWMDLAAERLYSIFIIKREQYWDSLSPAEQVAAIERGQPLLAVYGDAAARPRMARVLRKNRSATGSRVGFSGNVDIITFTGPKGGRFTGPSDGIGVRSRADEYYSSKYWEPRKYFAWQDRMWNAPPVRPSRVDVGDIQRVADREYDED